MRITSRMIVSMVTSNIAKSASRMSETQKQLSTGKRINLSSDDPAGTATALSLRTLINDNEQYLKNIDSAKTWLSATESALRSGSDLLVKVRTLAVQASNSTWGPEEQDNFATQIDHYLQEALQIANETLGGDSLFAGFQVDASTYTYSAGPPETVTYNGDNGQMVRSINTNTTMIVNVNGDTIFDQVFDTLFDMKQAILNRDIETLSKQCLGDVDECIKDISAALGEVGAKTNHLNNIQSRYTDLQTNLKGMLSKEEDLDYALAVSELTGEETIYKAALEAASKITKYSLLDYL